MSNLLSSYLPSSTISFISSIHQATYMKMSPILLWGEKVVLNCIPPQLIFCVAVFRTGAFPSSSNLPTFTSLTTKSHSKHLTWGDLEIWSKVIKKEKKINNINFYLLKKNKKKKNNAFLNSNFKKNEIFFRNHVIIERTRQHQGVNGKQKSCFFSII